MCNVEKIKLKKNKYVYLFIEFGIFLSVSNVASELAVASAEWMSEWVRKDTFIETRTRKIFSKRATQQPVADRNSNKITNNGIKWTYRQ